MLNGWRADSMRIAVLGTESLEDRFDLVGAVQHLFRQFAAELVAAQPDVLMTSVGSGLAPLLQATKTIPIVFTSVSTRSGPAWSKALHGPEATLPALARSNGAS